VGPPYIAPPVLLPDEQFADFERPEPELVPVQLPFAPQEDLMRALEGFAPEFRTRFNRTMLRRLGLSSAGAEARVAGCSSVLRRRITLLGYASFEAGLPSTTFTP
jgi:uncharacterized protein YdiU (UPF0061 family)